MARLAFPTALLNGKTAAPPRPVQSSPLDPPATYTAAFAPVIVLQLSKTDLVYPGSTNAKVCVTPATSAAASGTVQILDGSTLLTPVPLPGSGCANWYITPGTHFLSA